MVPVIDGVRIRFTAGRSHVMTLAGCSDIAIDNDLSVDRDLDAVAFDADLFSAPFAERLVHYPLCRNHAINGSMDLIFAEICIHGRVMVEYLHLAHSVIGGIHSHGSPHANAVVHAFTKETELETIDEITVFLLGIEVAGAAIVC